MLVPILLGLATLVTSQNNDVRVNTKQGTVVGTRTDSYYSFYGIRYAGDVSGQNRFKEAPLPPVFQGEYRADKNITCAQPTSHGMVGVEDCLTLDVFTKNTTGSKPVIVWLNGEEYTRTIDTPQYSFRSLVEADLVIIALNYRLSVFGFLCLGVPEAPGNAGLKDVIQALKWIKDNAEVFGGNPDNVILLGHGSGASMVDLITLSPQAENLVHKAIAISGSGIAPWAVAFDPAGYAKALGAQLGYTDENHQSLAKHFVNTTEDNLITAINDFRFTNSSLLFAPCVENEKLEGSFLTDAPINLIKAGKYLKIPYVAIYVSEEGTLRAEQAVHGRWLEKMQNSFVDFLPVDLKFQNETIRKYIGQQIRTHYFGTKGITLETISDYLDYWGDILITVPMLRSLREKINAREVNNNGVQSPLYVLRCSYQEISDPDWQYPEIPLAGTRHGAILKYIFDLDSVSNDTMESLLRSSLQNRIVVFANTGIPVAPIGTPGAVNWPPMGQGLEYLRITGVQGAVSLYQENSALDPHSEVMKFWEDNVSMYYAVPTQVNSAQNVAVSFGLVLVLVIAALQMTELLHK